MWIVDATFTRVRVTHMEEMNLFQAIWIGACQILSAVFPGTSRSMSTIAAGQIAGLSRPAALEFSFFLSMPTMVVATGYDLFKTLKHTRDTVDEGNIAPLAVDPHQWVVLAVGFETNGIGRSNPARPAKLRAVRRRSLRIQRHEYAGRRAQCDRRAVVADQLFAVMHLDTLVQWDGQVQATITHRRGGRAKCAGGGGSGI